MNLHIVPDSKFADTFYRNLHSLDLLGNNTFVVRTNRKKLEHITVPLPFGHLYSKRFSGSVGDPARFDRVFIHQLSPLMYRWLARHSFRELNWMVWGADLYNLPFIAYNFYEPLTRKLYIKRHAIRNDLLYLLKVYLTNMPFRRAAYSRVNNVLTWMKSEYAFAKQTIPALTAKHEFFFYENQISYEHIDAVAVGAQVRGERGAMRLIIGNSATPTNNHLDAVKVIQEKGIRADLLIPVSYGDKKYTDFLKRNLSFYTNGEVIFIDRFMAIEEYLRFLQSADGMVMNHIRPQGYGNIFMMMALGKPVFLNSKNISLEDLSTNGLSWFDISELAKFEQDRMQLPDNRQALGRLLPHHRLMDTYMKLFSPAG